jgi:hypothetical protein
MTLITHWHGGALALTDEDVFVRRTRLTALDASARLTPSAGSAWE